MREKQERKPRQSALFAGDLEAPLRPFSAPSNLAEEGPSYNMVITLLQP